jgi:hypothetical protein
MPPARRKLAAGAILILAALVAFLLGWPDDPTDALTAAVFVGTTAALGLTLVTLGLVEL